MRFNQAEREQTMRMDDFEDRVPSRLLGTCAALDARTGIPALLWRIAVVAALLCVSFKLTIMAYCVAALIFKLGRR